MEIEEWEKCWERHMKPDFLEYPLQVEHPVRTLITEKATQSGSSVLDVGCGSCIDYPRFIKSNIEYVGIDITSKFLGRAKSLYPKIKIIHGDCLKMPFKDMCIDVVYCKDLLEHLPPNMWKTAVREMWRIAKNKMMIAFFIMPKIGKTNYVKHKGGRWWINQYGKDDLTDYLKNLLDFKDYKITENIGSPPRKYYAIYEAWK